MNEMRCIQTILDKGVDGVIVTGGSVGNENVPADYINALNRLNQIVPVVLIGKTIKGSDCIFINRNLNGGVSMLVSHLFALGRRRIGFIGGVKNSTATAARYKTYIQTLTNFGLPYDPGIVAFSNYYIGDGYDAMRRVLESDAQNPTAIVAMNDMVALGAIRAINDACLCVPHDISVVSCDQFPGANYTSPRLTTVDQQNGYLGRLAIMFLIDAINGAQEKINIEHNPTIIIRESCGAQIVHGKDTQLTQPFQF